MAARGSGTGTEFLDAVILDTARAVFETYGLRRANIEDVAAHEFGHMLGLGHSTVNGATMSPSISQCSTASRSLHSDDIAGVEAIYPPTGTPTPTPSPTATPAPTPTPAPQEPLPRSIEDFDKLIEEEVTAFVTASSKIGGLVEEQVYYTS